MNMNSAQIAPPASAEAKPKPVLHFDPVLLIVYLSLVVFGIVAIFSATIAQSFEAGDAFINLKKNLVHLVLAVVAMIIVSNMSIRVWQNASPVLLVVGILLLGIVLIPSIGLEINKSRRWIQIAGWNFQPSEFAEIAFLLFAADYLTNRRGYLQNFVKDVLPILGIYMIFAVLLLLEPDFGSAAVLGAVLFCLLFLCGLKRNHIIVLFLTGFAGLAALIVVEPYRMLRLVSFLDPFQDPYGSGFQLAQSLIAFARGELFGVGIGNSILKLYYLPYAESDFILAIIAEELGFVGVSVVIALFLILIWRMFHIVKLAKIVGDIYAMTVVQAFALLITVAALINMGVAMGALPTKGLTLPFLSEGGTSLLAYSCAMGIVFSVSRSCRWKLKRLQR